MTTRFLGASSYRWLVPTLALWTLFRIQETNVATMQREQDSNFWIPQQQTASNQSQKDAALYKCGLPAWIFRLRERQIYSQSGEDGITLGILKHIPPLIPYYVEFGVEDGTECNTRILAETKNWTGLWMDGGEYNHSGIQREMITPNNVVALFQKYKVPRQLDVLSEDTDYADYYIWKALLSAGYRPRVLVGEVNSNFEPWESATVRSPIGDQARLWEVASNFSSNYFGVSPLALRYLWNRYGYLMVHCTRNQVNCFGIHGDFLGFRTLETLKQAQDCVWRTKSMARRRKRHEPDPKGETYCWVNETGDVVGNCDFSPIFVKQSRGEFDTNAATVRVVRRGVQKRSLEAT